MNRRPARVLVVDDSAVVRQVLRDLIAADARVGAVETAADGRTALRKAERFAPDVITLDVEMPGLDGLATLERLMTVQPRPVIMLSAYTSEGARRTIRALELGAVDFIQKPAGGNSASLPEVGQELLAKIASVSRWRRPVSAPARRPTSGPAPALPPPRSRPRPRAGAGSVPTAVVAIGASTGGTEAIRGILSRLPADFTAAIAVTLHMPEGYTRAFAERLDELCEIEVKEGAHGDLLVPGRALVAPGHSHLVVSRARGHFFVELNRQPKVSGHRPSVDVLFDSVADAVERRAIGVILTGMGRDGARGLLHIKQAGGATIAQDEASSVVYGMPKAAADDGAVQRIAPLRDIPGLVEGAVRCMGVAAPL